jgi:putative membrane protein
MRLKMTTTTLTGLGALSPLALAFTLGVTGCDERRDQRTTTTAPAATQEERRAAAPRPATPAPREPEVVRPAAPEDPGTVTPTNLAADERRKKGDGDAAKVLAALHTSNMNELALAKLGQQKAQMREVKQFSQMLLKEHSKADQMVMSYAKRKAISLTPDEDTAKDKAEDKREAMEKLRPLRGVEFDRQFAAIMVDEHDKAVDLVKDARGDVDDPELKGMLAELQGSLEKHLEHARHLRDVTKDAEGQAAGEGKDDPATRQGRRPTR